jgi:hypothetical protein
VNKSKFKSGGWAVILPMTAAIGLYVAFVFLPQMREIHAMRLEIADNQSFLGSVAQRSVRDAAVDADIEATRRYIEHYRGASSSPADVSGLFAQISDLLNAAGVTTSNFKPEAKQALGSVDRVPLVISCSGSRDRVQSLLAGLEQINQRLWVEELTMERGKEAGEDMTCELRLAIFTNHFEISD